MYRYGNNPGLLQLVRRRNGEETREGKRFECVARSADSLPYFLLDSSCRLPAASDISQTATILVRGTPTSRKYIQHIGCICVYTSRKERLEIQFKTDRILRTFSFSDPNFRRKRSKRPRERERERAHKRDRSVSILDHRYVETTRGKRWRRYPGDVAAAFQMLYPRVIDHAPLYIYLSLYGCTSFE